MSLLKAKIDFVKRGKNDELYTPQEAVMTILPYIPQQYKVVLEPTDIDGGSQITKVLSSINYRVLSKSIGKGVDYLVDAIDEDYDIMITNPPYSLKDKFLEKAFEIDKPFMMLLPLTAIEGKFRGELFSKHRIELLIPNKRFNFDITKKGAWFQTAWFCYKCNLPNQLNFIRL